MDSNVEVQPGRRNRDERALGSEQRFTLSRRHFTPAYLKAHERGLLAKKIAAAQSLLQPCNLCPRRCKADRWGGQAGFCRTGRRARVSSAFAHLGEEDCLRGCHGSGTIFFSGCNLGCVFCQNFEISQGPGGSELGPAELAAVMLQLQGAGCHNINLVTPSHVVPQILEALPGAIEGGLRLPLVYNTGGYDSVEALRLLDGVVDIFMPDFKLWNPQHGEDYFHAGDYAQIARAALRIMHEQVGVLHMDEDGLALRGLLVRHLVMPGMLKDTRAILRWLAAELSPDTYVNLMEQYHPAHKAETETGFAEINRHLSCTEYCKAVQMAGATGLWRLDSRRLL
jgi:putative pyruvate formate lyase activating enzyme